MRERAKEAEEFLEVTRAAQVEPFLRGCVWPAAPGVPYPRCDPGPGGQRLPADTRAAAALPVGVRLEFTGEAEAVEIDYRTETAELGYRGAGAGTSFALFRGEQLVSEAPAALGAGTVRLAAGRGPARAVVYLPEAMRPTLLALRAVGGALEPAPREPRWLCYGDSIAEGWKASAPAWAWPAQLGAPPRARRREPRLRGRRARRAGVRRRARGAAGRRDHDRARHELLDAHAAQRGAVRGRPARLPRDRARGPSA